MKKIKSFFLKFENQQLEDQYQLDKSIEIQRPVYLFLLFFAFISNSAVLALHFFVGPTETWYLNVGCVCFVILQTIVVVIMKKWQFQQLALTFSNIAIGLLQLNIEENTTTGYEYFSYGSVFMQLQCALYMVSNFNHALFQVIGHYAIRMTVTTFNSQRVDYLLIFVGIFGFILILMTLYVKDKNSRRYFIQNLKEHHRNKVISFLIHKPYFKIQYFENQLIFKSISQYKLHYFPGYDKNLCEGCNARYFLRNYQFDNKGNLEDQLLIKEEQQFQEGVFLVLQYQKIKFYLRVCQLDPQFKQYILIFEKIQQKKTDKIKAQVSKQKLIDSLRKNQKFYHQQLFNWGALTILYLNKKVLSKINFIHLINKIIKVNQSKFYPNLLIEIKSKEKIIEFCTYVNQLRIYLIQMIDIIAQLQIKHQQMVQIKIDDKINFIFLSFSGLKQQEFSNHLDKNYIIYLMSNLLFDKEITEIEQRKGIVIKKFPESSFVNKKY